MRNTIYPYIEMSSIKLAYLGKSGRFNEMRVEQGQASHVRPLASTRKWATGADGADRDFADHRFL